MKDVTQIWKTLANAKSNTSEHAFQYCILRAMKAKTNMSKTTLAAIFVAKAFTPVTKPSKLANGRKPWDSLDYLSRRVTSRKDGYRSYSDKVLGLDYTEIFDSEEEYQTFLQIWYEIFKGDYLRRNYCYFFVRKGMSPEQYAVQSAHVAYTLGSKAPNPDAEKTYFTLLEVADPAYITNVLDTHKIEYSTFVEPDMGNIMTAVATKPLPMKYKALFKDYSLLTVFRPEE